MTVAAKTFQQWLSSVAGSSSSASVCRAAGIKRSTLAQQLVRGRVTVATVVAVSRSLELPVVDALALFPEYADLSAGVARPTNAELLSQISDLDILAEILKRSPRAEPPDALLAVQLSPIPHRDSVRTWLDAIGPTDLRQRLARTTGIAPQNLSTQITANRLTPELAVASARIAGVGLTNGLVVTGVLSPSEAGWPSGERALMLRQTPTSALASLASTRLEYLSRTLKRAEQDDAAVQAVWENLG
ncbi:hypothetical protein [Arthrobacter cryoconiti]|uniref:Uncharacterized protein n=1 Tax=Arthrobacter cryoconiti TaxID=748907 RepID=A0ABV8QVM7_9MICC|nr:hypothetical protein [Arthrobacter cryoconiti]MCC9068987.1 hypothetical protein [Arthrobacter cryoconiti]